jgi:hypothetical protein
LLRSFVDPEALAISDHLPVIADIAAPATDVAKMSSPADETAAGSRKEPALS